MRPLEPLPDHTESEAWKSGSFSRVHAFLGAHPSGDEGVRFAVWAPNARRVSVVGDFNGWEAGRTPLEKEEESGIWHGNSGEAAPGDRYKFAVTPPESGRSHVLKSDPVAFRTETPPGTASVVSGDRSYEWGDEAWIRERAGRQEPGRPMAIYEVHLGSWGNPDAGSEAPGDAAGDAGRVRYEEVAESLARYASEMGFTHVELLPLAEYPYGASWGYQVTGLFAPTSRYGEPRGLKALVDCCHRHGLGVILDWVPGHFPKDDHGLYRFDGTPLFEHPDPRRSEHPDWGTANMDFAKGEVRSFLLSSASWWCSEYHIDGLRVDAVASMLYLDYSREEGEWLPNVYGGKKNLGAVTFLQDLNRMIRREYPGVITVAEESTSWPGVTRPAADGGLGFDYKWNMGWMNDTLRYFSLKPGERRQEHHGITFPGTFLFDERFILPFSHDEVVHLKGSLWDRMPGGPEQKLRNLKLLFLYWIGFPGKKLLFMGGEWGQKSEWSEAGSLSWEEPADDPRHRGLRDCLSRLLSFYRREPALHAEPAGWDNFSWVDLDRKEQGYFSFARTDPDRGGNLLFLLNFGPLEQRAPLPAGSRVLMRTEDPGGEIGGERSPEAGGKAGEGEHIQLEPCSGAVLSA